MSEPNQALVDRLEAHIAELTGRLNETIAERDKTNLLYEISTALNAAFDFDTIAATAVSFAGRLGAALGEIHLMTDAGKVYFKSTAPEYNALTDSERQSLVRDVLSRGLAAWVLEHKQPALILDTQTDERRLSLADPAQKRSFRSTICSPINANSGRWQGIISFAHPEPHHFSEQDLVLLEALASQISVALKNTTLLKDLQSSLQETNLISAASQNLVAASNLEEVYVALVQSMISIGAERCVLHVCDDLDINDVPKYSKVVYLQDSISDNHDEPLGDRILISQYPILDELVCTQETLVIADIAADQQLCKTDRQFLSAFGVKSLTIIPLVARSRVIGLLFIQHRTPHNFDDRELAIYHTVCNQSIVAIENAKQMQITEMALTETQTLYRAGRVLAGTTNLEEILQESLFEFLYSLNLDQGGITLLTPDRQKGELVAYVQNGQVQRIESLQFPIDKTALYQQLLLSGQPFQSYDVLNDPRLKKFKHFNKEEKIKSLLQAPMIIQGETIGWIGADSVKTHREFSQREIDLARAMADQIAITIQNRRLLEKSERQAEQLKTVAQVGKSVSQLIELDEILNSTVDLIRDQFDFYHVSIFLLDDTEQWAVVRAATGEIGQTMVDQPHRLQVDGQSIVGDVTANHKPRIALDVGKETVVFDNPLLPNTRSEMALPMISRGNVIGALDVHSTAANAFDKEDVGTLQIMADQLTAAIENARLFEQTEKNLKRTGALYRVGEALAAATDLQTTFEVVLGEYLHLLNLKQGSLMLLDKTNRANKSWARYINGRPVEPNSSLLIENDLIFRRLQKDQTPLIIEDAHTHPLIKDDRRRTRGQAQAQSMLFIPLLARGELVGSIVADSVEDKRIFSQNDVKMGEAIADQLSIWLENRRLLEEAQHRSKLLQAAADVSRAASSILDTDQLINTAVNLIRDRFDFYYVGLFLVDEAGTWAMLRAGTGKAGRLQIENNHRLKIGGGSMIGWSTENRQARIALDVGEEGTHFKKNKYLPKTRSEMALPLISRDEVVGALTVQSTERSAFSDEDITLLQTMADQLANATANARLFENVAHARREAENRLQETVALQQLSQKLSSTLQVDDILDILLQACTKIIGFDYVQFSLVDEPRNQIKAVVGVGVTGSSIKRSTYPLDSNNIAADIIRTGKTEIISGWDDRFDREGYEAERQANWLRLFMPVTLRGSNIGLIEAGFNKHTRQKIEDSQVRLLRAFMGQTVIALENAQRYEVSRRAARREEIIREITGKIRNAVSIDDIMKTTITELSKVVGASRGGITLDVNNERSAGPAAPSNMPQSHHFNSANNS